MGLGNEKSKIRVTLREDEGERVSELELYGM